MINTRKAEKIIGYLFLIAMFSSLFGGGMMEEIATEQNILKYISTNIIKINLGVFFEIVNALCVVGIAVLLYQFLYRINKTSASAYIGFRIIESIFCLTAAFIPLIIGISGTNYLNSGSPVTSEIKILANAVLNIRSVIAGFYIPVFFCLGAFVFYYLLFQSKLLPRFISVWGFLGAALILILNLIDVEETVKMVLALPIILNEIFLGFWLIIKGFDTQILNSLFETKN